MLAIWSLGLKTDRATLDIWMSVGKCLLANVSVGNFVSVCCNLSLAGALLQSEGELDCDVFQFGSALQSEQCSKAECQRVWRWQWSPSVTSPSLLPAWSLWRCSPIKSFMKISERIVWSLSEWNHYLVQMYKQQLQKRIQHFIWDMSERRNTAAKAKKTAVLVRFENHRVNIWKGWLLVTGG